MKENIITNCKLFLINYCDKDVDVTFQTIFNGDCGSKFS